MNYNTLQYLFWQQGTFNDLINILSLAIDSTHLSPPQSNELKNDQWLGVMVRSQGRCGKVVV